MIENCVGYPLVMNQQTYFLFLQLPGPTNMPSSVEDWLSSLRLSEYTDAFKSHGYTSMDRVRKLWELELATVSPIVIHHLQVVHVHAGVNPFVMATSSF